MDTVKVDMGKLNSEAASAEKENSDPGQMRESPAQQQQNQYAVELRKAAEEEEARQRFVEEEERKLDERKRELQLQLEYLKKQQKEEEERVRIAKEEEESEEARRAVERARIAKDEHQRNEEERLRKQKEEEQEQASRQLREEEERLRREEEENARRGELLRTFLEKAGFQGGDPNQKKLKKGTSRIRLMGSSGFSYPLHAAVELGDAEAVEALLRAGADPSLTNSKKQTPLKLAEAKNKQGSHTKVIAALAA